MMISAYQTRVGEGTQFDAPLQMIDPEVGATLRIAIEDDPSDFEQPAPASSAATTKIPTT